MFTPTKTVQLACVAAMVAVASVEGHGYMSVPKTTFAINGDPTQFCATMDGPTTLTAPAGQSFTSDPASNTKAFNAALKASTYKSVRALVDAKGQFISGANKQCGVTSPTGDKQPLPAQYVEWAHSATEGFTPSHQGPCEVWCDDNLAFSNENCATNYPTAPAKLPYDKTKCVGASMLKIYWLALHSSTWQAYINCAPLSGGSSSSGGGGGGSATSPVVSPTTAPSKGTPSKGTPTKAPATKAPAKGTPATKKPETGGDADEDCELDIAGSTTKPEVGGDADDGDCELDIPSTKKPETGADDDDCELDVAGEASVTPKPATKAPSKTDSTKQSSGYRSMEYGFDVLDESD